MNIDRRNARNIEDSDFPFSGTNEQQLRFILQYAALAPSNRNTQPWKFCFKDEKLMVLMDTDRALQFIDPNFRQLIISCGAAIKIMEVAARYFGYELELDIAEEGVNSRLLANIVMGKKHRPKKRDIKTFNAITQRQTNRRWFEKGELPDSVSVRSREISAHHGIRFDFFDDSRTKEKVADLIAVASRKLYSEPWYRQEFAGCFRSQLFGNKEGVSSYGFDAINLPTPISKFILKAFDTGKRIAKFNRDKILSGSPFLVLISSHSDSLRDWINTGRALSEWLLVLTSERLAASYLNQAIEVDELRSQLADTLDVDSKPQLLLRIGRAKGVIFTPRRNIEDCLLH